MTARITKLLLLSSALLLSLSLAAQYPSNPAKSRLGYQTTGDGLTHRGSGAPSFSPGTIMNAWMYLDTTNMILYGYKNFAWVRLPLANNGITMSGAYAQLGGSLNQNTTIESGTYDYKVGKTSGTNYAYHNIFGSGVYAGAYSKYGSIETDYSIGGGSWNFTSNDASNTSVFSGYPTGFDFTFVGASLGASQFKMDSTDFTIVGLDSYASHSAANAAKSTNKLYLLDNSRHIYIKSGTGSADVLGSGTTTRIPIWTGTNALGDSPITYNSSTKRTAWDNPGIIDVPMGTDAQRPSPAVTSDFWYNTTGGGLEWYNGTRWAKAVESTINIGTNARIPFFNSNGQLTESSTFTQSSNKLTLGVPVGKNPAVDIVTGTGDGTVNEAAGLRLRNTSTDGNTFYLQIGTSNVGKGGSNQGHSYIQGGLWGGDYTNPLILMPKGGFIGIGSSLPIRWPLSTTGTVAIASQLSSSTTSSNTVGGNLYFNVGTVGVTQYNTVPASISSIYDKAFFYQGAGLVFRTISGSDISGHTAGGLERMRISSDGKVGIGTKNPEYAMIRARDSSAVSAWSVIETATNFISLAAGSTGNPPAIIFQNNQDLRIATASNYYGVGFDGQWIFGTNGSYRIRRYGVQAMEASDLSKTFGNIAAFADDGTMIDYRITRDTSVSNADFTVTSAMLSSCQSLFISAEVTSGATDTVNIILPTPSASFKNNKVYVFGDDDSSTQWVATKSVNATGLYYSNGGVKPTATNYAAVTTTTGVSGVTYTWICTRRNSGTWNWTLIRQ
jgi:hypothetical protein